MYCHNTDLRKDLLFSHGPLDVLDHSSDNYSFGGKLGIDATIKHTEETVGRENVTKSNQHADSRLNVDFPDRNIIKNYNLSFLSEGNPVIIVSVNRSEDIDAVEKVINIFKKTDA